MLLIEFGKKMSASHYVGTAGSTSSPVSWVIINNVS